MQLSVAIIILISSVTADFDFSNNETQPVYTLDDIENEKWNSTIDRYFERCYDIYGCFPVDYPWKSYQRAHSVYPYSPAVLDVKFPIFTNLTRGNPSLLDIDDPSVLSSLKVSNSTKVYVIAHGFLELGNVNWMNKMMNEILNYDNEAAVVIVDWRKGASPPYYQAVANIRVVGAMIAHLVVGILLEVDMENLDNFHCIGHSLGSHICGYAGYYAQRDFGLKIGRISGLDPAKPYFEFTPEIVRLDPSDAKFVDIIHTDSATFGERNLGLKQPIGHVDFYPNGGRDQPVCQSHKDYTTLSCSHTNSVNLFTESINTKCPFQAISCGSYSDFLNGSCTKCTNGSNICVKFGFHSDKSYSQAVNQSFYLLTASQAPFCKVHYKISIKIAETTANQGDIGTLSIRMVASSTKSSNIVKLMKNHVNFQAGKTYTFLIISDDIGSDLEKVRVLYEYKLSWLRMEVPEISVEFLEVESIDYGRNYRMCSKGKKSLVTGYVTEFTEKFCGE